MLVVELRAAAVRMALRMQVAYDLAQARNTAGKIKVRKLKPAA